MVSLDDNPNATAAVLLNEGDNENEKATNFVFRPKPPNLNKYFIKDVLNILDSSDKKGKTKLKEIRRCMFKYLKMS